MKEKTPRVDQAELLKRTFDFDVFVCVRCGGRRRVLADVKGGVECERLWSTWAWPRQVRGWPRREAPPDRVVLRLEPPQPREPVPCRAPHGKAAWADVYPKGLRGFSTRLAYCSGGPFSGHPRLLRSTPHPHLGLSPAYTLEGELG